MARGAKPEHVRTIDLHGFRVETALRHLEQELTYCRARRISPVLVVTGRGWGSPGGRPVLAPRVRAWLEGPEGRALGVVECRPVARGGALSVRLGS